MSKGGPTSQVSICSRCEMECETRYTKNGLCRGCRLEDKIEYLPTLEEIEEAKSRIRAKGRSQRLKGDAVDRKEEPVHHLRVCRSYLPYSQMAGILEG